MVRVTYLDRKPDMTNAIILNENKHILLIHNCKNGSHRYEFPGGKLDAKDDNLVDCVGRELKEELGIEIITDGIFGDYETQTPEGDFLCRSYFAEILEGVPRIPKNEQHKIDCKGYVSYQRLEKLARDGSLVPNLVSMLPDLRKFVA